MLRSNSKLPKNCGNATGFHKSARNILAKGLAILDEGRIRGV
jgi:hypothetical protein